MLNQILLKKTIFFLSFFHGTPITSHRTQFRKHSFTLSPKTFSHGSNF